MNTTVTSAIRPVLDSEDKNLYLRRSIVGGYSIKVERPGDRRAQLIATVFYRDGKVHTNLTDGRSVHDLSDREKDEIREAIELVRADNGLPTTAEVNAMEVPF